jgi:hypothetical protein
VKSRSAVNYRVSYLDHIQKYWRTWQDVTGIVALKKITEMRKIEVTYVQPRDSNFNVTLVADVVVLPQDSMEPQEGPVEARAPVIALPRGQAGIRTGFRITANGLRLR